MSFGFSIGDFIAVPAFAFKVYKLCKDSTAEFQDVSGLVISLHCVLKEVAKFSDDLDPDQQEQLVIIGSRCQGVLLELEKLLLKYATLSTKKYRIWDKLRWGLEDVKAIKGRLVENTILLNSLNTTFINSSQSRVEVKLDKYTAEIRAGKRNGSVLSCRSMESLVSHDGQAWSKLRKELEAVGISGSVLEQHQQFIIAWFDEAVSAGALKEGCKGVISSQDPFTHRSASYTTKGTTLTGRTNVAEWAEAEGIGIGSWTRDSSPDENDRPRKQDKLDECLQIAIRDRNTAWAEELLDFGANPDCCNQVGRKMLQIAFDCDDVEIMALLLENGADASVIPTEPTTTLLHHAVSGGHIKVVQLLLDKGANVEVGNDRDETALHVAACHLQQAVVQLLLNKGADIDATDTIGYTALHVAASVGDRITVQILLDAGANIEAADDQNQTALYAAVIHRKIETVQLLLERGIPVDSRERVKQTALHAAASAGDEMIMQLLLENGANIEATDSWDQTALHVAAAYRKGAIVQQLLDEGANIAAWNVGKCTAIHIASDGSYETNGSTMNQREAIITLLLDKGADVESNDKKGNTPLHYAAVEGNVRILRLLLDRGADLGATCGDGKTALHNAAQRLRLEAVQLLLEKGVDVRVKDVFGRTAADYVAVNSSDSAKTRGAKAAITQVLNGAMEEATGGNIEPLCSTTDGDCKEPLVCAAEITSSECIALAYWPTGLEMGRH